MKRELYPDDWEAVSHRIRFERAGGRCECTGECGLHKTNPGPRRCEEINGQPGKWSARPGARIVLTVAHLNHTPGDCQDENLRAMCQRCHLRYDRHLHVANRKKRGGP